MSRLCESWRKFGAILLVLTITDFATAQLPVIELGAVFPAGAKAGSEIEVRLSSTVRGEEVDQLRFSHPGIVAQVMTEDPLPFSEKRRSRFGHFKVQVAKDVPPGRYEVRAIGRHGVSNPRSFLVHNLPSERQLTASHLRLAPTELAIDTVVHSKTTASEVDYYRVQVAAGVATRIELFAAAIDSRMIGQMQLLGARGKIVQYASGSDELDPSITIKVEADETFTLAVSDAIFRGGEEYGYQLVMRTATGTKPLVRENVERQRFARSIGGYRELVQQATRIEETPGTQPIELPCMITAEFDSRNDIDQYQFTANEGDQFTIDVVSERLGQPTDARVLIERAEPQEAGGSKWMQVAIADDSQNISDAVMRLNTNDPIVGFRAPVDTTYRLTVWDLDTGTALGKKQRYWIDMRKPKPRFDLIAYQPYPHRDANQARQRGSNLFRSGVESIRVFAVRRDGWTGPIEISVEGLPEGVTSSSVTMEANINAVQIALVANDRVVTSVASLKVLGKATIEGKETTAQANFATTQWGRGGQREFHRSRLADDLVFAVSDRDLAPITFAIGDKLIVDLRKGGELKLPIKLTRQESAKSECIVRPRDLPPNVAVGEVKIAGDQVDGELVFRANNNAVVGTYSLWLQSETKIKHKSNPQALERAKLYRDKLQKLHDDPSNQDKMEKIKAAIKFADSQVESAKANAKDQDLTVFLPSPSFTIRIVD